MYSKELFEKYPYAFSHYAWTGEVFMKMALMKTL